MTNPDEPHFAFLPGLPRPLSLDEVAAALASGIRAGTAGSLSRNADAFLATLCSHVLAERLERDGLVVIRSRE